MSAYIGGRSRTSWPAAACLSLLALIAVAPLAWLAVTSLKQAAQTVTVPPVLIPNPVTFDGYASALGNSSFVWSIVNSVLYSSVSTAIAIVIVLPAAYAVARVDFRAKNVVLLAMAGAGMVPLVALLLPLYYLANRLQVLDTSVAVIVVFAAQFVPQAMWFLRNYIAAVPLELEEQALIDGCGRVKAFLHVTLPLIRSGLAAVFVLGVILAWNDYVIVATLIRDPLMQSVQVRLVNELYSGIGISWVTVSSYVVIATLPVLVLFGCMQRAFVRGMLSGAVKG
jgi:multiple sugar transport system permease protein